MAAPSPAIALTDLVRDAVHARNTDALDRVCAELAERDRGFFHMTAMYQAALAEPAPWQEGMAHLAEAIQARDGHDGVAVRVCTALRIAAVDRRNADAVWALLALLPTRLPPHIRRNRIFRDVIHPLIASVDMADNEWPGDTLCAVVAALVARATTADAPNGAWEEADYDVADVGMRWLVSHCVAHQMADVALAALRALTKLPRRLALRLGDVIPSSLVPPAMPALAAAALPPRVRDATWQLLGALHAAGGLFAPSHVLADGLPYDDDAPPPQPGMDVPSDDEEDERPGDDDDSPATNPYWVPPHFVQTIGLTECAQFLACGGRPTCPEDAYAVLRAGFRCFGGGPNEFLHVFRAWLAGAEAAAAEAGAQGQGGDMVARAGAATVERETEHIVKAWAASTPLWVTLHPKPTASRAVLRAVVADLSWAKRGAMCQLRAVVRREALAAAGEAGSDDES